MWEANRKHKLKCDAIPTVFGFFVKKQISTKDTKNDGSIKNNINEITSIIQSDECTNKEATDNHKNAKVNIEIVSLLEEKSVTTIYYVYISFQVTINDASEPITSLENISFINEFYKKDEEENEKYKELIKKQQLRLITMRKKMKALRFTIRMLKNKINNDKYKKALNIIFNEDQIRALSNKNRTRNWSDETIQRALKLKFACGAAGYEELLQQKIPLPSLRTLRRKLENFQFKPGISKEMFEFLKYKKSFFNEERDIECELIFDEMTTSSKCYNPTTGSLNGFL